MSEKERNKAGLHKEISSIFSGVLIPQPDSGKESSDTCMPEDTDCTEPNQAEQILPKVESTQETEAEPVQEPKVEPVQESKAEPVEELKAEPVQEHKNEPIHAPKFMMAHESEVVPVQESEIESFKDSKAEPTQKPKVIPIQESEDETVQESETEPARQNKVETTKKPKVTPVQRYQKADIDNVSEKVSKKSSAVKVGGASSWKQITSKLFTATSGAGGTKQKAMVVMIPVLFIALLIFVLRGGVFGTNVHNAQTGEENNNSPVVPVGLDNQIDWEIPEPYPTTLRDPMQLAPVITGINQAESRELAKIIVKSILCSEDNSSAIIDNRIVHEGDQIQNASVIKISKDGVEFEMNGKKWTQKVQR